MKEYKTLTREKVDAEPGAARYMGETHMMEDWSDKMIDLVLNGPTLNGFRKDEVRAMLRQTYAALKQYEQIGPHGVALHERPVGHRGPGLRRALPRHRLLCAARP